MTTCDRDKLDELIQLVSFKLGQEEFGVDIRKVQEINRMVEITRIPQAPNYCEGVINLRGKVLPVIDLRRKFGMDACEWTRNTRIVVCEEGDSIVGMIVDAVEEVRRIPHSSIEPPPAVVSAVETDYISGIVRLDERLLIFLSLAQIVSDVDINVNVANKDISVP